MNVESKIVPQMEDSLRLLGGRENTNTHAWEITVGSRGIIHGLIALRKDATDPRTHAFLNQLMLYCNAIGQEGIFVSVHKNDGVWLMKAFPGISHSDVVAMSQEEHMTLDAFILFENENNMEYQSVDTALSEKLNAQVKLIPESNKSALIHGILELVHNEIVEQIR